MNHSAIAFLTVFCTLIACPTISHGQQGIDDDLPPGVPDLLLFSDGQAEPHDAIDLTLSGSTGLTACGIALDADLTQFYYGVASGGREQDFRYSGHGDYVANFDMDKLVGQEGLFVQVRAEHRFGNDVNTSTGAVVRRQSRGESGLRVPLDL